MKAVYLEYINFEEMYLQPRSISGGQPMFVSLLEIVSDQGCPNTPQFTPQNNNWHQLTSPKIPTSNLYSGQSTKMLYMLNPCAVSDSSVVNLNMAVLLWEYHITERADSGQKTNGTWVSPPSTYRTTKIKYCIINNNMQFL